MILSGWNLVLSGHTLTPGSRGVGPRVKECPEASCSLHSVKLQLRSKCHLEELGGCRPAGGHEGLDGRS